MDKGRTRIIGEIEESESISVKIDGRGVESVIVIAAIIKNLSDITGVSATKIMRDITTMLENKWLESEWTVVIKRVEEE